MVKALKIIGGIVAVAAGLLAAEAVAYRWMVSQAAARDDE